MFLLLMSFWMFSFSTSSSPFCIFIRSLMLHASYPSYGSDVRSTPLHCYAFFVSLKFFFFGQWKKTLSISLFLHLLGRKVLPFFSSLSLSFHYLPSTTYLLPSSPTTSKSPFFYGHVFNLLFVITLPFELILLLFLIKI